MESISNRIEGEAGGNHVVAEGAQVRGELPGRKKPNTAASRTKSGSPAKAGTSKAEWVLKKLRTGRGATIEMLMETTGWQAHSVRGFLSGTVRKKLGHSLISEISKDGVRRYRIDDKTVAG